MLEIMESATDSRCQAELKKVIKKASCYKFSIKLYDFFFWALCKVSVKKYIICALEEKDQFLNRQIKGTKPTLVGFMLSNNLHSKG